MKESIESENRTAQETPAAESSMPESPRKPVSAHGLAWGLFLVAGLLLTLTYILLPYGPLAGALYVLTSFLAATGIGGAVYWRSRLFCPSAWAWIAIGVGLAATGHVIWYWLDFHGLDPFPSLADVAYLAGYPAFMVALWMLGRHSAGDDHALSDALTVGVSAGVLGWAFLIAPWLQDPSLTGLQLVVSTAYPVADVILLTLALRFVFLHRTRILAHLFLLLGMLAYLSADVLYAHGNSAGWYTPGGVTDGLWLAAYTLFIAAVWHPSASLEPRSHASRADLSVRRVIVMGAAAVVVPAVSLFAVGSDGAIVRVAAIGSIVLFLLFMYRITVLLREVHLQADALERIARIDPLTGAANRRNLQEELEREMGRADRNGTPLALAFLDLDHFKRFNDTFGHSEGDALLRELVAAWRDEIRPADVLARFGGEEFVVVFPDTRLEESTVVVERLRAVVPRGQTCSAGIAVFHKGDTADGIVGRADQALYRAKNSGRDRVVLEDNPGGSRGTDGSHQETVGPR